MACKSSVLTELAPAKINLALHVTGLREDGYHLLESLVVFTRFGDILSLEPAEATTLSATGHFAEGVPLDGSNLILRARICWRRLSRTRPKVMCVSRWKRIFQSPQGSVEARATPPRRPACSPVIGSFRCPAATLLPFSSPWARTFPCARSPGL